MLKTCTRCRARRIRCDSQLPACHNCSKSGLSCLFHDDILGEDIPRAYIKRLYDRVGELESIVSTYSSEPERSPSDNCEKDDPDTGERSVLDSFRGFVRTKPGYDLFLGSSPPVVIGNATLQNLLKLGVSLESASMSAETSDQNASPRIYKPDKSCLSPDMIRCLTSHYARCIETVYPTGMTFAEDMETSLKQLDEVDRCKVLLACAIAATHKSYHQPSFRVLSAACREWVGELITSALARRDDDALMVVILLIIYELADPERGLLWKLLTVAQRLCLELGWHLERGHAFGDARVGSGLDQPTRQKLLATLLSFERPLSILSQRPAIVNNAVSCQPSSVYDKYQHCIDTIFGPKPGTQTCPVSESYMASISHLQSLPADDAMSHEAWLLFHPLLISHTACAQCAILLGPSVPLGQTGLYSRISSEASDLINSVHAVVTSQETFLPPIFAAYRAFMGGCVIITAIKNKWPESESNFGALLKCSEVLSLTASLWQGGRDYLFVYRQIANSI